MLAREQEILCEPNKSAIVAEYTRFQFAKRCGRRCPRWYWILPRKLRLAENDLCLPILIADDRRTPLYLLVYYGFEDVKY